MTMPMTQADEAGLARELLAALKARSAKLGPLAAIVLLHLVLFYLLQSGLLRKVAHAALPEVINISFVSAPTPPKPAPPPPKTVPVARQAPTIAPQLPVAVRSAEPAITLPQAPI
ncbi:MAG: energy transducer TonB, partial [Burkholderiaceae bacterium]|nr:energy transducer TonB [Burkholderiaceae bacterium]